MANSIRSIRGFNDILPERTAQWQALEATTRAVLRRYGYREIRLPYVEPTELFKRAIGEVTDIVEKEMYTFADRNGDSLTLRPEGTAGCLRAAVQNGLLQDGVQRLWYEGAMFRHERPQRGRYRQFHQIGVEAYGLSGPDIDAELILLGARLWRELGLTDIRLQLNSLGSDEARAAYRERLVEFLCDHRALLDEDSLRRLETNPLRILDSKHPAVQAVLDTAPTILDQLDSASAEHLSGLRELLAAAGVEATLNPRLVRGIDYYSRTVFEWVTERLGAQGTVCAGGRYDGLFQRLGAKPTPAVGFALGVERLVELLVETAGEDSRQADPQVYVIADGAAGRQAALSIGERLRDELPTLRLMVHCGGGSFKSQFKKADKSGADWAMVLGEAELADGMAQLKPLRRQGEQVAVPQSALAAFLTDHIN